MIFKRKQKTTKTPYPEASVLLYKDVFVNAPFGIYTLDEKGVITSFNPKMVEISGDDPAKAIGLDVFSLDTYKKVGLDKLFAKGLAGEGFETEVEYTSYLGNKKSIRHYTGVPIKESGQAGQARLLLIVEDVTEKRQIEQQLLASIKVETLARQRLVTLINNMGDAVIATDQRGNVILYNSAALDLLNTNEINEHDPITRYLRIYTKDKKRINIIDVARKSGRIIRRDDLLFNVESDEFMNLYVSMAPVRLGYGQEGEEGFVLLLRDITKEKSIEEQRDEFISVVSHELRTPIAIVEANISTSMLPQVLEQPEKASELLDQAHRNIVFLAALVNDITTLSHVEQGQLEAALESVDPTTVLHELAQTFHQKAKDKNLKIKVEVQKDIPAIESNAHRLKEILQNFITNAIKYTVQGTVTLTVKKQDETHVIFAVGDTGIGISKSDQKHVFEKFWRSEDYRTQEHHGTGLGLYIAKKLAERMRGTVTFESSLHKGSVFYLTVPLKIKK